MGQASGSSADKSGADGGAAGKGGANDNIAGSNTAGKGAAAKHVYTRFFLVSLAMIALAVFVMWERFTSPSSRGGMGLSPGAVIVAAGILVGVSALACRSGYARQQQFEQSAKGDGRADDEQAKGQA